MPAVFAACACSSQAAAVTPNAIAGATLLPQAQNSPALKQNPPEYRQLTRLDGALHTYLRAGNTAAADELAASFSGAGIANLNAAWRGQMDRQLRAIRNRITSMQGGMACYEPDPKACPEPPPTYTLWANAEIDYRNQRSESSLPGYKLNSIGGTAGFSMLAAHELTIGAAFTGMSGRLSSKGYGSDASGDLDAYYASFFVRMDRDCWQHSLIGSAGWADINFKRRLYTAGADYGTRGSTDGLSFGIMYEMAYTFKISDDTLKSAWWQPVLNISYIHSSVDAYTESGSVAALNSGKQESNNVLFGFGARMQGIVGEQFLNTPAIMEARILGRAMAGARRGKAQVSVPGSGRSVTITGAEPSAFGVEIGVGFNIPLGINNGGIFTDFTAEFYRDMTAVNGTLGYRIDF